MENSIWGCLQQTAIPYPYVRIQLQDLYTRQTNQKGWQTSSLCYGPSGRRVLVTKIRLVGATGTGWHNGTS